MPAVDDGRETVDIPSLPSLTQSTSETEEERRRILEGIFAEDDDDEDEDYIDESQEGEYTFLERGPHRNGDDIVDGGGGNDDAGVAIGGGSVAINAGGDGIWDSRNGAGRMGHSEFRQGEEPPRSAAGGTATAGDQQWASRGQRRKQKIPPSAALVHARKQRTSENAFSSSSEDEDYDDDDHDEFVSAFAEPVMQVPSVDYTAEPGTTSFSNTRQDVGGDRVNESGQTVDELMGRHRQPDLMDAAIGEFSWIHSGDSGDGTAASPLHRDLPRDEVRGQPTLSFNFSQDTASVAALSNVRSRSPPSSSPPSAFSHSTMAGQTNENDEPGLDAHAASSQLTAASLSQHEQQQLDHQQQQHKSQQSAFDRALDEVQQGRGGSLSNSFSFPDISSPRETSSVGLPLNDTAVGAVAMSDETKTDVSQALEIKSALSNNNQDEGGATAESEHDDFFAKAENTIIDEIKNYDAQSGDSMTSNGVGSGTAKNDGGKGSSLASPSSAKAGKGPKSPSSAQAGKDAVAPSKVAGKGARIKDRISLHTNSSSGTRNKPSQSSPTANPSGLPDVLSSMRQKIESFNIFDGDGMSSATKSTIAGPPPSYPSVGGQQPTNMLVMDAASSTAPATLQKYYSSDEERESMRRAFQQSISAAVLVSLAHKRYERRRLAAMDIEKVVRSLVVQEDYSRVRAILLLLSDDYVRSTNEDARKGGAVALAACAIGLKKANEGRRDVTECRDLILASVVHACQDHSQRVRYYATESLFNLTKVIPSLAVQHFFILFEILRSLYADVDLDVRSGAELLDKKLKEVIVGAINSGSFSADACVPVFARFVCMRNKATKQLTLTWLKEFSEKLIGAPILQFLHLFLGGIFAMVADPNAAIRTLALEFLSSILPKLLVNNEDFEDAQQRVDFDKVLQSLVLTMEHPDPFVRKVAMYWMSRIVQAHMSSAFPSSVDALLCGSEKNMVGVPDHVNMGLSAASISVRNALPHVLPGILLSIGDTHQSPRATGGAKDALLPDQTTHSLADQANTCLQDAVRRDGQAFVPHLGGFIVALREELDSPGGLIARNPPSLERRPYRMDVKVDGSGIESTGWFRASDGVEERDNALILSRLCALQWVVVLYEHVVPESLRADYASEFIDCIIYQLVDQPPGIIVVKSFEVLARISNPAVGEEAVNLLGCSGPSVDEDAAPGDEAENIPNCGRNPMTDENAAFALGILDQAQRGLLSRDRGVFTSLIDLHSKHQKLMIDISKVIELMCTLQPPEFVFVSFAFELDNFIVSRMKHREKILESPEADAQTVKMELISFARDLAFVSNFAQQLGIVFFAAPEMEPLREVLKDSIGFKGKTVRAERRARLFHILLNTFSHNIVAALAFCLWGGAFLTASTFLQEIDPLDVSIMFYLEIDQLIDLIERPLFRHLHLRMLECEDGHQEGSGAMLFRTLKSIMMLLPQSTSYMILKERLTSVARYRQSAVSLSGPSGQVDPGSDTAVYVGRIVSVRRLHCDAKWRNIRAESLEEPCRVVGDDQKLTAEQLRREWLGYADEEEELASRERIKKDMLGDTVKRTELVGVYENLNEMEAPKLAQFKDEIKEREACQISSTKGLVRQIERIKTPEDEVKDDQSKRLQWREYWASRQ